MLDLNEIATACRYADTDDEFIARARTWLPALVEELTQAREEIAAVDESLGEFYAPVLDPETENPCGSFWKDHGVNVMRQELERARREIATLQECGNAMAGAAHEVAVKAKQIQAELQEARAEIERLRRAQAKARHAFDWLWGFWDGNTLVAARAGDQDEIQQAFERLANTIHADAALANDEYSHEERTQEDEDDA